VRSSTTPAVLRARYGIASRNQVAGEPRRAWESNRPSKPHRQEALHNAGRHARATEVRIVLMSGRSEVRWKSGQRRRVRFEKRLPGIRFEYECASCATDLGGKLDIESHPGVGTTVPRSSPSVSPLHPDRSGHRKYGQVTPLWGCLAGHAKPMIAL